jgi:hypothetical protein
MASFPIVAAVEATAPCVRSVVCVIWFGISSAVR